MMIYKLYTIKMMIYQKPVQTKECAGFSCSGRSTALTALTIR